MNIIFDSEVAQKLKEKYTVLELDTVMQPKMSEPLTLYAVVETVNISEISTLPFFKEMHEEMITAYKGSDWEKALGLASSLRGQFSGELDEFYGLVIDFCKESAGVNRKWDGVKHTVPVEGHIIED
jgi:hypothetical protein